MRVLLWGELFWPNLGGAELFAATLMRALRRRGYEFAVIASHDAEGLPDEDRYQDIPIFRFRFREALTSRRIEQLAAVRQRAAARCRDLAPDLIHLNGIGPNIFFCRTAMESLQRPLLVRVNRELQRGPRRAESGTLVAQVLQRAAWVVGVSAAALQQAQAIAPEIAPRSSLIYNGVESTAELPAAAPPGAPRILCLGRLAPEKRFDLAISALPEVLRQWPAARMTLAGDGPKRAALAAQAAALGVAHAVEFAGWVAPDAVAPVIAAATVVVLPSYSEGLPAVALQAAALARPLVATRTGGLPEIVQHGATGLLIEPNGEGLAAAIVAVLGDRDLARRFGSAAWRRARELFAAQSCVDAYDALYRQLAGQAA